LVELGYAHARVLRLYSSPLLVAVALPLAAMHLAMHALRPVPPSCLEAFSELQAKLLRGVPDDHLPQLVEFSEALRRLWKAETVRSGTDRPTCSVVCKWEKRAAGFTSWQAVPPASLPALPVLLHTPKKDRLRGDDRLSTGKLERIVLRRDEETSSLPSRLAVADEFRADFQKPKQNNSQIEIHASYAPSAECASSFGRTSAAAAPEAKPLAQSPGGAKQKAVVAAESTLARLLRGIAEQQVFRPGNAVKAPAARVPTSPVRRRKRGKSPSVDRAPPVSTIAAPPVCRKRGKSPSVDRAPPVSTIAAPTLALELSNSGCKPKRKRTSKT